MLNGDRKITEKVIPIANFNRISCSFPLTVQYSQSVYLHLPENLRLKIDLPIQEICFVKKLKKEYPLHTYERLPPTWMRDIFPIFAT
ncbi:MAG: hypothetical protein LBV02_05610 [Bacteroidales bacterium]|nr:hypothetical protein [Bacteroidales bacterium]